MSSKFLIINADDFGYNRYQNEAIKELLSDKLITSTSVMAVAPEFDDAAQWLKENKITAGIHLTINSDSAESPWKSITGDKSLGNSGFLFSSSSDITKHGRHFAVATELEAQYLALKNKGVEIDYADNHCGTLYGINLRRFYNDANEFCSRHSLPYRFPKTPFFTERQLGRKAPEIVIKLHKMLVNKAETEGVRLIDDLVSNPLNINHIGNYETLKKWYIDSLDTCAEGVTEMFLHPALPIDDKKSEWTKRVFEYQLLKSGDLLQAAEDKGFKLISRNDFRLGATD